MKTWITIFFLSLTILACGPPPQAAGCPEVEAVDEGLVSDEAVKDACTTAGKRLSVLGCKEARRDFATFCPDIMAEGIDLKPKCLTTIKSCAEVNTKCR